MKNVWANNVIPKFGLYGESSHNQDPGFDKQRPGNADALSLSSGQTDPPIPDFRVKAPWKGLDKIINTSVFSGIHNGRVAC